MSHESEHSKPADQQRASSAEMPALHGHASEEAEHAQHHAHAPFDKRVALSMVVIAAVLAGVKVLGHRAHNDALDYRIQAGAKHSQAGGLRTQADTLHTQANDLHTKSVLEKTQVAVASTEASNKWAYSQAKKLRQHYYEVSGDLLLAMSKDGVAGDKAATWKAAADKYAKEATDIQTEARALKATRKGFYDRAEANDKAADRKTDQAEEKSKEADHEEAEAKHLEHESAHAHHKGALYDLGEMSVELALVVCSVAILVKRKEFWYGGLALGGVGLLVALFGLLT
jgi:hypothetical protein